MFTVIHWTEHRVPNEEARENTQSIVKSSVQMDRSKLSGSQNKPKSHGSAKGAGRIWMVLLDRDGRRQEKVYGKQSEYVIYLYVIVLEQK
jgi:hypothetical protein